LPADSVVAVERGR